jgi:O-antigen/teichoic acid export membrane protein
MEKCVMISEIAGAVVDVVINWKLIPVYGAAGAAAATTIAEIVVLAVQLYYIRDILPKILKAVQFKYVFIPLCVAVIVITVTLRFQCGNSFVQLLWTACLFFGVFGVGMLIMKEPLCVEIYESISVVIKKKIKSK